MIFGFLKKRVSEKKETLDAQEKTLDEQGHAIDELLKNHQCCYEEACKVCEEVKEAVEATRATAVVAKEISSRKIHGRTKTDIIRRNKLGLAAGE